MPFGIGYTEALIIGALAVMLFGDRLPSVARSLGRSFTEFKQGLSGIQNDWNEAVYSEPSDRIEHNTTRETPTGDAFAPPQPEQPTDQPASQSAP